jgi:hypothetical protein
MKMPTEREVRKISKKLQGALLVFSKEEFGTGPLFSLDSD